MELLACVGGPKACPDGTIPAWPDYGEAESDGLQRVLSSRRWWRGSGSEVDAFEREFADFNECEHALAVCNGTHALEIALGSLGVGPGDEVIVPAFTFAAAATAVLAVGALPVPVDVDRDTYCATTAAIRSAISARTQAIVPVHLAGHPCDMDGLAELSARRAIPILSDSAHAHGARWRGATLASLSRLTAFSFQAGKLMTAGEGGAIVGSDLEIMRHAWLRHTYGRPRGDRVYQHLELGTNARMTEFQAVILRAQLARFPRQAAEREEGTARLDELLADLPGVRPTRRQPDVTLHSHYMYMVACDESLGISRDTIVEALVAEGVPAFRAFPAIPDLEMFRDGAPTIRGLSLDSSPDVVREALDRHPIPEARSIARQSVWLHHQVLLGGPRVQASVARAFEKVLLQRDQLERRPAAVGA